MNLNFVSHNIHVTMVNALTSNNVMNNYNLNTKLVQLKKVSVVYWPTSNKTNKCHPKPIMAEGKCLLPVKDGNKQFAFTVVQLLEKESEILGSGSYGTVCKAKCDEIMCAAKKIYPALFQVEPIEPGREHTHPLRRFEAECYLLKNIDHPNIVQYLGTYRDPDTNAPVLLMELMDESLTHFLESSPRDIPYHIQVNLSYDIAQALAFLHSNGIIHRDLSSNNVLLLAGSRAKITDFGMSKWIDTNIQMTKCPGTPAFMPPEALDEPPVYTEKLDNFSLGVIIVQIITRLFPNPTDRFANRELVDPKFPMENIQAKVAVPEIERRQAHISRINGMHSLLPIALECLKNKEFERPTSKQLCQSLGALKEITIYQQSCAEDKDQIIRAKDEKIQTTNQDLATKIRQLQENVEQLDIQKDSLTIKDMEIERLTLQLNEITDECDSRTRQLRELGTQVQSYEQEIDHLRHVTTTDQAHASENCSSGKSSVHVEYSTYNPFDISRDCYAVVGSKVYFRKAYDESNKIYEYDLDSRTWSVLKADPVSKGFTIVSVDNMLTIVGGEGYILNYNKLYCFLYKKWVEIFPPMNNRRVCPHAVYAKRHLIVVQRNNGCNVEILNIDTLQWSMATPFPKSSNTIVVTGEYIYSKYYRKIRKCLLSDQLAGSSSEDPNKLWQEIRVDLPLHSLGCIVSIDDHLLVVGGEGNVRFKNDEAKYPWNLYSYKAVKDIYEYIPSSDSWTVVGQMSVPRSYCLATSLPNNKLMIVGSDSTDIMNTC